MEYHRVLRINPESAYTWNNLAAVYLEASPVRNYAQALSSAEEALRLVPLLGSALFYKGKALNMLGMYSEARALLGETYQQNRLPSQKHSVKYEEMVAKSNMNEEITEDELGSLLSDAEENDAKKHLLEELAKEEEQKRFRENDAITIRNFIAKHRNSQHA